MQNKTLIFFVSTIILLLCPRADASSPDLWDATKNAVTITNSSATDDFFLAHNANLLNMFTPKVNVARPSEDDATNTLFGDTQPAGFVHFVEWQTPAPVTLGAFNLYAVDDHPSFNRSMDRFTLYAWNGTAFKPIFDSLTSHPYTYSDPAHVLLFSANVTPVTTDRFRAEFVQNDTIVNAYMGLTTYGPRVLELDGFVPEPGTGAVIVGTLLVVLRRSRRA